MHRFKDSPQYLVSHRAGKGRILRKKTMAPDKKCFIIRHTDKKGITDSHPVRSLWWNPKDERNQSGKQQYWHHQHLNKESRFAPQTQCVLYSPPLDFSVYGCVICLVANGTPVQAFPPGAWNIQVTNGDVAQHLLEAQCGIILGTTSDVTYTTLSKLRPHQSYQFKLLSGMHLGSKNKITDLLVEWEISHVDVARARIDIREYP